MSTAISSRSIAPPQRPAEKGCLAVNAAFLQDIKDDNRFLDELLLATRDALSKVDPQRLQQRSLVELLRRLRDRLAMHFSLEEAFGYFDNALDFDAALSMRAVQCRGEHVGLYLDICEVVDQAEGMLYGEPSGRARASELTTLFSRFYRRLLTHNAQEQSLIDAAMTLQRQQA